MIKIDTTNILFIVGGAFDGIENIVKNRLGKKTIGFGAENGLNQVDADDWQKNLTTGDLVKFGLIPEFIGRIPIITTLDKLRTEDLIRILTSYKDHCGNRKQHGSVLYSRQAGTMGRTCTRTK